MKPVKVGIIGCGVIGSRHLSIATEAPHIELVAAADLVAANRQRAAERFNPPKLYATGEELLNDDEIEAVVLAFPTQHRTEMALRAFNKGKHVLIEKPIAMNASEVRQLIAARGELTSACCSSRKRFTESARIATDIIARGKLGELRTVYCRAVLSAKEQPETPRPAWRLMKALNGGGILVNWGCYDIDYLLGLTGWQLQPKTAFAQTWTVPPVFEPHIAPGSDAETHYAALIRCENGVVISMERGEYTTADSHDDWRIIGTEGSLALNMGSRYPERIIYNETRTEDGVDTERLPPSIIEEFRNRTSAETKHETPLADFAAAIRENREPMTSLEQALVVQKITDAIYASAAAGTSVEIEKN